MTLRHVLPFLPEGGAERRALAAGELDAVVDYAGGNVIVLPAARRALREAAERAIAANSLLANLPHRELQSLLARLERRTLKAGEVLQEPGKRIRHAYFPVDCVISLRATTESRQAVQVALVGYEGMVGVQLALGEEILSVRAVVQSGGTALAMAADEFRNGLREWPSFQRALYRHIHAQLFLARQTVACNCFHAIDARLARLLLMSSDRMRSGELLLTQASLAEMLGARRATINEAAVPLQKRKLIAYSRGRIRILDRRGLEAAACTCYARLKG